MPLHLHVLSLYGSHLHESPFLLFTKEKKRKNIILDAAEDRRILHSVQNDINASRQHTGQRVLGGGLLGLLLAVAERILLRQIPAVEERRDYKTTLQEVVQRRNGQVLTYHMVDQRGLSPRNSSRSLLRRPPLCSLA